ncbi:MAG: polyprenyl synthetase family protein [Anaerolineae bacterium]|nr:polyprenyl synthetase family protein [Anaerolineae bacterium]
MDNEQALHSVDRLLHDVVDSDVDVLRDASRHILEAGGKRVRPRLTLLAYEAVGGKDINEVLPIAAAVELVHTATLVHDDINDHGSMRRGRPTVNARWGRTFALLTGDFLFTKVYQLMAPFKDLNIIFAEMTMALVEGETLQAAAAKSGQLDRETYARIIAKKTASLFAGAAKMGAILGGGTPEQVSALEQYGFNTGLAFQIVDDILDLIADSQQLGKTAGLDMAQGKGFATMMAGAHGSKPTTATAVVNVDAADPLAAFKQKMMSGNYIQEGREQANQLATLAQFSLNALPASEASAELFNLAQQIIDRDH